MTKKKSKKRVPTGAHQLAITVCKIEGGKQNLSIAQVKEVIRILGDLSKDCNACAVEVIKALML